MNAFACGPDHLERQVIYREPILLPETVCERSAGLGYAFRDHWNDDGY